MSTIISSFFTKFAVPELGLAPTIRIWEVEDLLETLVINGDSMSEVGDGFYKYVFASFDPEKNYVIRSYGGPTLPTAEQYSIASSANTVFTPEVIATSVWDKQSAEHLNVGSMGLIQNQTYANSEQLVLEHVDLEALLLTLLKYERNRTRIDKIAKTLTIYDDDGTTPLKVFNLKDSAGAPYSTEVCERSPV